MSQFGSQMRAMFDRAFPERQIYHRSGGTVRYVSLSPSKQALLALSAVGLAGWCVYATGNTLLQGPQQSASNAEIGPAQALDASFSGCGIAQIGDVAENLSVDLAGSGEVRTGSAGELSADLAGSGELFVGAVANGAKVDVAGSGRVEIASLTGALSMDGAGSGNLLVQGGAITDANIDLAGSGDVSIAAPVQRLEVSIVGSGDVDVAAAVGDIEAEIAGSGGVSAQSVTGAVHREVWGSGEIRIGQ